MLTRKTYKIIADVLRAGKPPASQPHGLATWEEIVRGIAQRLEQDNARFSWGKFYAAAGYEGKAVVPLVDHAEEFADAFDHAD